MTSSDIIKKIIERRKELKWTQAHLAGLAGLSRRTMVSIEDGAHDIGIRKLERVLNALSMSLSIETERRLPKEGELLEFFREDDDDD